MNKEIKKILILLLIISFIVISPVISNNKKELETKKITVNPFNELKLEAKSVYVFDVVNNKSMFEFNSNAQLPLASLTKIMTAIIAKESMPDQTVVTISKKAIESEGDDKLNIGERWLMASLIDFTLIKSSNDGASAISENVEKNLSVNFIDLMNKKANELNLRQTYFINETGLDITRSLSGSYGSATDMSEIMKYALLKHPDIFEATVYDKISLYSLDSIQHNIENTNQTVKNLPNIIGSKTGFTDLAGGNLAVIFDAGFDHPIIVIVLGSTIDGRFSDMEKLINTTFEWFQYQ